MEKNKNFNGDELRKDIEKMLNEIKNRETLRIIWNYIYILKENDG